MQTFGEQMSSAGRAQVQAQLELFSTLATAAIDNAARLALLQLNASREALDRSGAMWFQMLSAGRPAGFAQLTQRGNEDDAAPDVETPAAEFPITTGEPAALRNPIAEAAAQLVPGSPDMHPLASTLPDEGKIELPRVKPLEAAPPAAAPGTGPRRKQPRK